MLPDFNIQIVYKYIINKHQYGLAWKCHIEGSMMTYTCGCVRFMNTHADVSKFKISPFLCINIEIYLSQRRYGRWL
jgi:hypothetical protein